MAPATDPPRVHALARNADYAFSKAPVESLRFLAGLGVEGDVHCGETVKHRSRVAVDPTQPNLRQVHLIASELFSELREQGFDVEPGALGENVTTAGIDLLALPTGTQLRLGQEVRLEVTGLRNPCGQINGLQEGLLTRLRIRTSSGEIIRRAGIMAVVRAGGEVETLDPITVELPPTPHRPLECV